MGEGTIKRKRKHGFTGVSNAIIQDKCISLRAKGLYALMQFYLDIDGFELCKKYLASQCIEGERAFDAAWKELKENGYIVQKKIRGNGPGFVYEYDIYDEPTKLPEEQEKPKADIKRVVSGVNKRKENKKEESNGMQIEAEGECIKETKEAYSLDYIKKQIDYEKLKEAHPHEDLVDSITLLLFDRLNSSCESIKIAGEVKNINVVKSMLLKVNSRHIEHVIEKFNTKIDRVSKTEEYLLTMLYKAPIQQAPEFQNYWNRTYYGGETG